jgi:hypothetical protein
VIRTRPALWDSWGHMARRRPFPTGEDEQSQGKRDLCHSEARVEPVTEEDF